MNCINCDNVLTCPFLPKNGKTKDHSTSISLLNTFLQIKNWLACAQVCAHTQFYQCDLGGTMHHCQWQAAVYLWHGGEKSNSFSNAQGN